MPQAYIFVFELHNVFIVREKLVCSDGACFSFIFIR